MGKKSSFAPSLRATQSVTYSFHIRVLRSAICIQTIRYGSTSLSGGQQVDDLPPASSLLPGREAIRSTRPAPIRTY